MISGTFHPIGQEWRYFSREKALIHTLHLAQLPASVVGSTVEIASTAPTSNPKPPGIPPMPLPSGPNFGANASIVTNEAMVIDCFGAVNCAQAITAQSKMGITIGSIGGALSEINMSPEESGYFVVYSQCYTDVHSLSYEGVASDGQITLQILNGGSVCAQSVAKIKMAGGGWTSSFDFHRRLQCQASALVHSNGLLRVLAYNLGVVGDCCLTMWAMKVADDA